LAQKAEQIVRRGQAALLAGRSLPEEVPAEKPAASSLVPEAA
jgi:hypothetical protein